MQEYVGANLPDYTKQLDAIVSLLRDKPTPAWLIAILSGFLGGVGGICAQIARACWDERRAKIRMRELMYVELQKCFDLAWELRFGERTPYSQDYLAVIKHSLESMTGWKYAQSKPDVFLSVPEATQIEACFSQLARVFERETVRYVPLDLFMIAYVDALQDGNLDLKYLKSLQSAADQEHMRERMRELPVKINEIRRRERQQ